ncbi:SGNH/GDSL hydrolase family protein [Roseivirga sp. E12]|uniref:SGNH/GDSL hydrolase family protein n=1 Tax=Roseivirga sp. E12 TaxID=2819237 RepID=UPI001ABBF6B3|nr:SGNH/GDSL hydrolase family protein [Roseivirga sp. E12]MBO3697770.1 SGNH/GDSL hydrolase family protein [Roseivirga sp. E12]
MKNIKIYLFAILALTFVIQSCDEDQKLLEQLEDENPLPGPTTGTPGTLDFSKYVSVGNSLTAGFMDNALYTSGQDNSFPNLLSQQFSISGVGGGAFNQPDINSANGRSGVNPAGGFFGRFELSLSLLRPVPTVGENVTAFAGDKSALNNFGVPGMRLVDVADAGLAGRNGLYARFASQPGVSTVLGDALQANPTFFSFWLGNNDILGYAAGGGANEALITDATAFQASLTQALGGLTQSGAQGVVMTIPQIILAPFFRAVPYNAIPMTDPNTVTALNNAFAGLNAALDGLAGNMLLTVEQANARKVSYQLGANPILMFDDALTDIGPLFDILVGANAITAAQRAALEPYRQSRPATSSDLPVLTAATSLGQPLVVNGVPQPTAVIGVSYPAPDNLILSESEVTTVVGTRATYNATIAGVVAGINQGAGSDVLTLVDVQPTFADISGTDAATARFLVDPTNGANPALAAMGAAAAAAADGELGIRVDGVNLAPDFSPNGIFSTDGIHPNPRGYAIIANLIIDALNASKGSSIPKINVLALRGVLTTN